jgi:hypothetical protein
MSTPREVAVTEALAGTAASHAASEANPGTGVVEFARVSGERVGAWVCSVGVDVSGVGLPM